jgi:CubicO group peptidase (beta-lactamase class C family)
MASFPKVKMTVNQGEINGFCDARFERVVEEFKQNFQQRGEVGASVCVMLEGETVVDMWGGTARPETNTPWKEDTIGVVWSSTKGATSLCAHMLASRGKLDLDAPVAQYWPEFAQGGKAAIPVKMLLNHQAGLIGVRELLPPGLFFNWEGMVHALERQEPWWKPGSQHGYHALTFGWLVGEVVRRVSGKSLGTFFREEVAGPLGLDFWIGLPEEHEHRTARVTLAPPPGPGEPVPALFMAMADPTSLQFAAIANSGGYYAPVPDEVYFDSRAAHAAEIGAAGGITNARGLAGLYAPLANGGSLRGVNLVSRESLARMSAVSSASGLDSTLLLPTRFTLGYAKGMDNHREPMATAEDSLILPESAFGHPGAGGSIGFADPETRLSFGYTMNRMGGGIGLNARGQSLIDAVYLSLGYSSKASGAWMKG